MTQEEATPIALDRRRQRQFAEEVFVRIREGRQCKLPRGFRHGAKGRRAARVRVVSDGVIVVTSHDQRCPLLQALHDLCGFWTVVDQITEHPQLIVRFGHGVECIRISVHVRDDQNLHRRPH